MIITHLFLNLKTKDEESVIKAQEVLMSMKGKIDQLKDISVETDIGHKQSRYDMQAIGKFESLEDLKAFLVDPAHTEAAKYILSELDAQMLFYIFPSSDPNHQAIYENGKQ